MAQRGQALGVDFGTSNSAAGVAQDGRVRLIELSPGQTTIPTTFFFEFDMREILIGDPANAALLEGAEGRFMRALKRVLGTSLMHEKRRLLNEQLTFVDIIGRFLRHLKDRAEADTGQVFDRAVSGRPVVFHGADDPRERQAEDDLRACYHAAGFQEVEFLPEPEAAAIASGVVSGEVGLIVDIGGGTSDFSLFRAGNAGVTILANHGVRIGGTDFDRAISIDRVMPLLGLGTEIRKAMGAGTLPAPKSIFHKLATWEEIPFLYTTQNKRMVAEMTRLAEDPGTLSRLGAVLEHELGHELAFAVERGKIEANSGSATAQIGLNVVEQGLFADLPEDAVTACLAAFAEDLDQGAIETLARAGLSAERVDRVIYVGGSSLMTMVPDTMKARFPQANHSFAEVFTAVAEGLAIAAGR
ncbi:MAG: Hsp70 family protein [Pseudomonadota bacterium]